MGVLMIVACQPTAGPATQVPTPTPDEHQVQLPAVGAGGGQEAEPTPAEPYLAPAATSQPTEVSYPDPVEGVVATAEAYPEPQPTTVVVPPTPRAAMEATDPATVSLASGGIQLVEFFAFW